LSIIECIKARDQAQNDNKRDISSRASMEEALNKNVKSKRKGGETEGTPLPLHPKRDS
jgi:hypothetical protein